MRNYCVVGLQKINRRFGCVQERKRTYRESKKQRSLLISLGPEVSASVYKHLSEEEIERLTLEISGVKKVEPRCKEEIIEEFHNIALSARLYFTRWYWICENSLRKSTWCRSSASNY